MGKNKKKNNKSGQTSQAVDRPAEPVRQESEDAVSITDDIAASDPIDTQPAGTASEEGAPVLAEPIAKGPAMSDNTTGRRQVGEREDVGQAVEPVNAAATTSEGRDDSTGQADTSPGAREPAQGSDLPKESPAIPVDRDEDAALGGQPPAPAQRDEERHSEHSIRHAESDTTAFSSSSPQAIAVTSADSETQNFPESASPPQSPTPSKSAPPMQPSQADGKEAEDDFAALIGSSEEPAEAVEETIEAPTATQNAAPEAEGMDERDYGAGQAADSGDDCAAMIESQAKLTAPAEKQLDDAQEHSQYQKTGSTAQSPAEPSETLIVANENQDSESEDLAVSSAHAQHAGGMSLDNQIEDDDFAQLVDSAAETSSAAGASSQPGQTVETSPAVGNPTSIAALISTDSSDHDADDAFARLAAADEASDAVDDEFAAIAQGDAAGKDDSEDAKDAFATIAASNDTRAHHAAESEDGDAFATIAAAEGSGGADEEGRNEDDIAAIASSNGSENRREGRPGDASAALASPYGTGVGDNGEPADDFSALLAESEGAGDAVATGGLGAADAWGDSGAGASKWDDLMDEFSELDDPASSDFPSGPSKVTSQQDAASADPASLFDDDDDFDKILEAAQSQIRQMAAQHPEPRPHVQGPHQAVSAEQLFTGTEKGDANAWLDDTSMDISPAHDQPDTASTAQWTTTTQGTASSSDETALDFDVPEGWVDDDGIFRYYTSEEKAAVRKSMMGEQYTQPEPPAQVEQRNPYGALQRSSDSYYGNSGASENAARRTPQPQGQSPPTAQTQAYDPYAPIARPGPSAPPAAQPTLITPAVQAGFIPAPPPIESYAPAPASTTASYDPYAPGPAGYAAPYTSSSRSMPPSLSPNPPPVAKPAPPMRVASNAYDPPLKPQKSFIRAKQPPPAPATPALPPSFPSPAARAQPTPPPGPPPGPPRRAPSVPPPSVPPAVHAPPAAPPSRPPSAFVPPPPALTVREEQAPLPDGGSTYDAPAARVPPASGPPAGPPRGPPSRPPSAAAQRRAPSYNSFDPPPKPASVSRPSSRASQRPHFEAPPPVPPLPPAHRAAAPPAKTNAYPDENAARSSQPPRAPPPPGRPASRSAVVPPPPGPPGLNMSSESPRQPIARMAPPPGPPPRRDSPETPAEELFQNSGVPVSKGWPHLAGEQDEDDEYGTRADPRGESPRQTVLGRSEEVTEDLDPEGGMANDDSWDEDQYPVNEPQAAPPTVLVQRSSSFGGQAQLSPQSSLGLRDGSADQAEHQPEDSYGPSNAALMPAPPRGPPPGPPPSFKRQSSTGDYSSYEPAAGPGANFPGVSPTKSRPPIPSPFMAGADVSADPYAPSAGIATVGQISEAYTAAISHPPAQSAYDSPYGPPAGTTNNGYAPTADPYARTESPVQSGDYSSSAPDTVSFFQSAPGDTSYVPQQVLEQRPVSEDPLGRGSVHAKNVPLAVFGFGGVLVFSFPAQATEQEDAQRGKGHARAPSYGYASVRGKVWIRGVADMASSSSIKNDDGLVFPGPLLYDAATKGVAAEKKKREALTAYLEARADEVERGLPYLKSASSSGGAKKRREEEGKVVLIRVLAAMLLDEGKDGKEKYREGLVKALSATQTVPLLSPTAMTFAAGTVPYGAPAKATKPSAAPSSSQMSTLTELLSSGNKREAAEYAARQGLWSHALILASSVGPDLWRDTVKSFADAELSGEGFGGMKAAYLLFAGGGAQVGGASQVDELFSTANITDDPAKDQWKDVIGSIVLNGQAADAVHLDDLGARFAKKGLHNAAAVCYLLSATSPFADPSPNAVNKPISILGDTPDEDAIIFAEVAEYARSLLPVPKGQEVPFAGLPRLLPYKLQRAWLAAELGETELAVRYCQAVEIASKAIKNGPALLSSHHTASLEDLMERLTGSPSIEPAKNLSARKATAKPGFDKLGSWLEGRLTKFIAGDDETPAAAPKPIPDAKDKSAPVGPFSHFASISPSRSADVSRNPSIPDFGASGSMNSINGLLSAGPPSMGGRSSPLSHASSNYGYDHTQGSPSRRTATLQGYSPFQPSTLPTAEEEAPRDDGGDSEVGELLNPMAALSFGAPTSKASYAPAESVPATQNEVDLGDDDEDDLGFGNAALSRNRTPMPPSGAATETSSDAKPEVTKEPAKADKSKKAEAPAQDGAAPKKGWLTGWFGKKEEGGGPVRAKLGDENAMVFDPDLKRWVVKGQKPDAAPAAPPPPPRSSTATPAGPSGSSGPPAGTPPTAFNTMPRAFSSANLPPGGPPAGPPTRAPSAAPPGAPPGPSGSRPPSAAPPPGGMTPVSGPPKPKGAAPSIDDLLSRPSSKRPGSSAAARKGAKNRYVDVFQQPQ